jgi:hypothetical protein
MIDKSHLFKKFEFILNEDKDLIEFLKTLKNDELFELLFIIEKDDKYKSNYPKIFIKYINDNDLSHQLHFYELYNKKDQD